MKIDLDTFNIKIGDLAKGKRNSITDVEGVKVGHITYDYGDRKTGITAILPHEGNIFREKLVAASHVINGFGKSIGMMQIDELGSLETPILLTNTFGVGKVADGLIKYMLKDNDEIGERTATINPLVCECNDGYLNRIQDMFLDEEDVFKAIDRADVDFEEGAVGAGTGMVCYGLKGGIGSSSRLIKIGKKDYTVGVLVLTNFGRMEDLTIAGKRIGKTIKDSMENPENREDKGSIIVVLATDIPLSHRQLNRVIKRTYPGISNTGSFTSTGSGELVVGFSTGNRINHYEENDFVKIKTIREDSLNEVFKASKEATEEAILSSLFNGETKLGRDGNKIKSLMEYIDILDFK